LEEVVAELDALGMQRQEISLGEDNSSSEFKPKVR
jgi:hypothetical protein